MSKEIFQISQIQNSDILPIGRSKIMRLIKNGELFKEKKLKEWENYIIAMNISDGDKNARWRIEREEIEEWKKRAKM